MLICFYGVRDNDCWLAANAYFDTMQIENGGRDK